MATNIECIWTGRSGIKYTYYVYDLPISFEKVDGNYIYCKIVNNGWVPVYIGQGDLADRVGPKHHKAHCIYLKGATHIHVHTNTIEKSRIAEESDLLANYTQAYEPTGCNEKTGG